MYGSCLSTSTSTPGASSSAVVPPTHTGADDHDVGAQRLHLPNPTPHACARRTSACRAIASGLRPRELHGVAP